MEAGAAMHFDFCEKRAGATAARHAERAETLFVSDGDNARAAKLASATIVVALLARA